MHIFRTLFPKNTSGGLGLFFCDLRVCFFLLGENLLKYFSQLILSVKLIFFFQVSLQKCRFLILLFTLRLSATNYSVFDLNKSLFHCFKKATHIFHFTKNCFLFKFQLHRVQEYEFFDLYKGFSGIEIFLVPELVKSSI